MAVEKQRVITRLKALFPKANLSQKRLDDLSDKLSKKPADDADDAAIDVVINDFNEILSIEDIAKGDDRTRTLEAEKKKAEEAAAKNKGGKKEEEEEEEDEEEEIPADTPSWAKALIKSNKTLKADLDSIKSGNVLQNKKQTATQLFEKSETLKGLKEELKPRWINRIDINSETSIEDQIKELETEYSELVQINADSNSYAGPAGTGSSEQKPSEAIVNEIVDNLNI